MDARRYEFYLRVLKKYLTSERSERVRYFQHEKIKFVSPSGHAMFCLLYKIQWPNKKKCLFIKAKMFSSFTLSSKKTDQHKNRYFYNTVNIFYKT